MFCFKLFCRHNKEERKQRHVAAGKAAHNIKTSKALTINAAYLANLAGTTGRSASSAMWQQARQQSVRPWPAKEGEASSRQWQLRSSGGRSGSKLQLLLQQQQPFSRSSGSSSSSSSSSHGQRERGRQGCVNGSKEAAAPGAAVKSTAAAAGDAAVAAPAVCAAAAAMASEVEGGKFCFRGVRTTGAAGAAVSCCSLLGAALATANGAASCVEGSGVATCLGQ
jgi:hypothetical protein